MKKLPIGIQTFRDIIKEDYLYIDKTKEALELIENYRYSFLSRPRRFGKSLFLDTLHNIFEGKKELFEGLYIYDKWDWEVTYPVIKISWSGDFKTVQSLKNVAYYNLKKNQERLDVFCENDIDNAICFSQLIEKTHKKYNQKVVILIDEYDKPILDVIENIEQAKINRDFIKSLYSIIKDSDQYIKFTFLTGVSKFSKASIFSGLNMLSDISLMKKFGNICGYTQKDIETIFLPYLEGVDMKRMKKFYNGYNFLKDDIYNPFDTLLFIDNDFKYSNYWFTTGNPSFLIKLIEKNNYFLPKLTNLVLDERLLDSFDIENIDIEVILYQSGYLTIDEMIDDEDYGIEYKLKIPNKEVQQSLSDVIVHYFVQDINPKSKKVPIGKALKKENLEGFKEALNAIFASIPNNNYTNNHIQNYEGFYASIVFVYLQSLGLEIIGEDVTNRGRIDLTIKIENLIYVIEFKVNGNNNALQQIKSKGYSQKYLNEDKTIYEVGIEFSQKEKAIVGFEWERVE